MTVTSVERTVGVQYAKAAVSMGAGYLGHEAGEALGLPEWANILIGVGAGAATGFGVEALDRSYNFSGYHISKSVQPSRNITKDDLLDDVLKTKPKNSPDPEKWLRKNGRISIDEDGTWTYTNADGQSVKYQGGYPDFKEAGLVKQEVDIGEFNDYSSDFQKADALAPNGPRDAINNTWHHSQDGHTMQEINKGIHKQFTHRGGMSIKK